MVSKFTSHCISKETCFITIKIYRFGFFLSPDFNNGFHDLGFIFIVYIIILLWKEKQIFVFFPLGRERWGMRDL